MTEFHAQSLELIRQVESGGEVVEITRHGKLVAPLTPPAASSGASLHPWAALHGSGVLHAEPGETVLEAQAFDALR
ncbi:MAG TPA: type II toxin-antitoxin system prevent-host-death family antitoxin [Cyanobium sp.]|nr:type II toxin-antitoxin system prevent-host-death family antitoxin [Cyanobium sp.]